MLAIAVNSALPLPLFDDVRNRPDRFIPKAASAPNRKIALATVAFDRIFTNENGNIIAAVVLELCVRRVLTSKGD